MEEEQRGGVKAGEGVCGSPPTRGIEERASVAGKFARGGLVASACPSGVSSGDGGACEWVESVRAGWARGACKPRQADTAPGRSAGVATAYGDGED